jgi:hypothetical protein
MEFGVTLIEFATAKVIVSKQYPTLQALRHITYSFGTSSRAKRQRLVWDEERFLRLSPLTAAYCYSSAKSNHPPGMVWLNRDMYL